MHLLTKHLLSLEFWLRSDNDSYSAADNGCCALGSCCIVRLLTYGTQKDTTARLPAFVPSPADPITADKLRCRPSKWCRPRENGSDTWEWDHNVKISASGIVHLSMDTEPARCTIPAILLVYRESRQPVDCVLHAALSVYHATAEKWKSKPD